MLTSAPLSRNYWECNPSCYHRWTEDMMQTMLFPNVVLL